MPTYDYQCKACGHELEIYQSMSASPKKKCPKCGALKLTRLIGTGGGILFKGGGFYETDYRSASYKEGAAAEKKAKEDKPAKSEAKSNGKAAKPDEAVPAKKSKAKGKKKSQD